MRRLINVAQWPAIVVFLAAGALAVIFAFVTVNLFTVTKANIDFIKRHGALAISEGALVQLAGLILWGLVALATWVGFKICETELIARYRRWVARGDGDS